MNKKDKNPPRLARWILNLQDHYEKEYSITGDCCEEYKQIVRQQGKLSALFWIWGQVFSSIVSSSKRSLFFGGTMFINYLKITLRNIKRHKVFSFINIAGFAIGMAVCLLILIYVRHELSYDKYHKDEERVYRIVLDSRTQTANRIFAPITAMVAPTLKNDYPQVEQAARSLITSSRLVRRDNTFFYEERFMYADPELFDVLTIPFIQGNSQKALTRPRTLVISERMSLKYFGYSNPIGETIEINNETFEITGIVVNSPENTHLKYDLIASMETLNGWEEMNNWYSTMFYTYLKLRPNVNVEEFSQQVSNLSDKYVGEKLKEWGNTDHYFLQPISSIHLHSHIRYEAEPSGNPLYVTIFSFVGLFILLIACLNFMNLSTARSTNRAKEVGMRKVVGAKRFQLISQFLGESLFVSLISLGFSMVIAKFAIPIIDNVTGIALDFNQLLNFVVLISLIVGSILVGLAAGVYPALVLSAFRPTATLKRGLRSGSRDFAMRNVLVVVQFSISVVLIVGTLIMARQFNFMKNQHLGFEKEQKLVLPLRGGISIQENYETVKDLFSKHPSISDASVSSTVPGRGVSNFGVSLVGEEDRKNQSMFHMYFDHDFVPDYGIEMVAGRAFQKDMSTDIAGAFLINEATVIAFGWSSPEEALGKRLQTGFGGRVNPIIGVTKNFHYRGLQTNVEPLVMEFLPEMFRYITLSIDISNLNETLAFTESQWKSMYPNNPFENFFLDTYFDQQYRSDEQVGRIFGIFTILGLFIACLGLLGLASFTAESRTKEIGIRKVLGASVPCIVTMLTKQFTKWVLLANCLAWPVAYYIMTRWLKNFAYRTDIDLFIFVLSGLLVLGVALLTVSYQSIRAATINPAESLRYE
jgi:putative ABC transport system permease protein